MSGYYNASFERDCREKMTPERILRIAKQQGSFSVSLRYRDDWLRSRCYEMRKAGLLRGGKRRGRELVYEPA